MKHYTLLLALFFTPLCSHSQVITTFAGSGLMGAIGDGIPATASSFENPISVCADAIGNIYISDINNCCIRMVNTSGIITTFAGICGTTTGGFSGDGGPATAARLSEQNQICLDGIGNMYIADAGCNRIRKVSATGIITTVAGSGSAIFGGGSYSGDGHPATDATLNGPNGVYADGSGNVYIADTYNDCIRKVDPAGIITTIAGIGGSAGFSGDGGPATTAKLNVTGYLIMDGSGNLYISDAYNYRVRKLSPSGYISTYAGNGSPGSSGDGFPATTAKLNGPDGMRIDASGNLYIADFNNNNVRMVNPAGIINTFAGNGGSGESGDGGPPTAAQIGEASDICIDGGGNFYITDTRTVRKICIPPALATITGTVSVICPTASLSVSASLTGGAWGVVTGNASVSGTGTAATATGVSGGVDTITYTLTNSCYFTTAKYPVTVNPAPYAGAITGPASLCLGATDTLTDTAAGGTWYPGTSGVASIASAGTASTAVTGIAAGAGVITYSVTNACGTAAAVYPITVNLLPVAGSISGAAAFCAAATIPLTASLPGGVWSSAATAIGTIDASGNVTGIASGIDTIKYTVTNGCGVAVATTTVTVNPLPVAGSISGAASVCAGAATPLSATVAGGTWSSSTPTIGTVDASGNVAGIAAGAASIAYSVTNGCGTAVTTTTVTVLPLPVAGTITGAVPLCALSTLPLSDTSSGGVWSSGTGIASVSSAGVVTGLAAGTGIISYSVANVCGTAVATTFITVDTAPDAGAITGAGVFCEGTTLPLTDAAPGGVWSSGTTAVATIGSTGIAAGVFGGTSAISYSVTNACGTAVATTTVTINPLPPVGAISGSDIVCALASTTPLSDAIAGGVWSSSNTAVATVGSTGIVTGVSFGDAIIYYTVTNSCGSNRVSISVSVNTAPNAGALRAGKSILCPLEITYMLDSVTGGTWSSSNAAIAMVNSSGIVTGESVGTALISYTLSNSCGASHALFVMDVVACTDTGSGLAVQALTTQPAHIIVSPNPSDGTFNITLPYASNENATIIITNILGEQIKTFTLPTNKEQQIKIQSPPGIYTITATINGERYTAKIVIR